MDSSGIPTDGPETILGQAARRLKLRYSRTFVARKVAGHRQPSSLLALVETANELGMKATAGQMDPEDLDDLSGPTIVHFSGVEGGGFGLLEKVDGNAITIWDSVHGLHQVDRKSFLAHWSGIVALIEPGDDPGPRETGYLRNRATEFIFSGYEPPAVVGSRAANFLRALFGVLLVAVVVLAVAKLPDDVTAPAAVLTLLTLIGLGVTVVTGISIGAQDSSFSSKVCGGGKYVNCQSVLSSRYSRIFGIPLSDLGIAFYGSLVLLIATDAIGAQANVWSVVALAYALAIPFALVLIGVQIGMRQLCTLCLAVHTVNIAGAIVAWTWLRPSISWDDLVGPALVTALFLLMILFLGIPYFRKHQGLRILAGMHRRISSSPFASLAELLTEPPVEERPAELALPMNEPMSAHTLVIFVNPTCNKCDPALRQVQVLAERGSARVLVGLAPKDPDEDERDLCTSVLAVGLARGSSALIGAYRASKQRMRSMLDDDPLEVLTRSLDISKEELTKVWDRARAFALQAEELVGEHAEGTPAVFFNGRLFRGELSHLAFLLERHPDLLEQTLPAKQDVPS